MLGLDVSHWQGKINWGKVKKDKNDIKFVIMKATESTAFLDNKLKTNREGARNAGLLCGFYHFARGGDYKKEADWFLKNVGELKEGELLALDYEIHDLRDPAEWCRKWLDYVYEKTGVKPLLYTYDHLLRTYDWRKVKDGNYGLWSARYGDQDMTPEEWELPHTDAWDYFAIWQFSSKAHIDGIVGYVDLNYTTMNLDTLKKYGKQDKVQEEEKADSYKRLLDYLGDLFGRDYGDKLNDSELSEVKDNIDEVIEKSEARQKQITALQEKIVERNRRIEELEKVKQEGIQALGKLNMLKEALKNLLK